MYIKGHEEPNVGNERDKRVAVILFSALLFRLGQVDGLIIMHTKVVLQYFNQMECMLLSIAISTLYTATTSSNLYLHRRPRRTISESYSIETICLGN